MQEPIEINYNGKTYWGFKSPCPKWLHDLYRKALKDANLLNTKFGETNRKK